MAAECGGLSNWERRKLTNEFSGARGPPEFLKKRSENAGANENLSGGFAIPGIAPRVAPRFVVFALLNLAAQVVRRHSENGSSHSENCFLNSELPREYPKTLPELREWPFTPRAYFLKSGWSLCESETVAANRVAAINPPIDDTDPIRKFGIDPRSHTDLQNPAEFSPKGKPIRNFSIDRASSIRIRLRTPLLRTPFPRLPLRAQRLKKINLD